jgi:NSS family neurotransmitter:Na+ symporter
MMEREHWKSRIGFFLAATGSAIGLGNIWRFPYLVGIHGGAAFVLVYLIFVLILGVPIMMAEMILGRKSQRDIVGTYKTLAGEHSMWILLGWMGIITGLIILSYYTGIAGWTLGYTLRSFTGSYWVKGTQEVFKEFISSPETIIWLGVFMFMTGFIVIKGIQRGIEKYTKILMPILFLLLIVLLIRSLTLKGAMKGVEFYLKPDFSRLTPPAILAAAGQAFFSLSLGMGIMITYGSYLKKGTNIFFNALTVSLADTLVAFLAGFIIFPAVFSFGLEPAAGPGLTFITIPQVFTKMPLGRIFAVIFFVLLAIAALTSTISLLEVLSVYGIDEIRWTRKKSTLIMGCVCFILGIFPTLSFGLLKNFTIFGKGLFDAMDFLASNILLLGGGVLISVFLSWHWGIGKAIGELRDGCRAKFIFPVWSVLIRFISPLIILIILISGLEWLSLRASLIFFYVLIFIAAFYFYPLIWIGRDARRRDFSPALWRFLFLLFWFLALILYLIVRPKEKEPS